jgi:thiol-disulfide isomerase/thioredoxin
VGGERVADCDSSQGKFEFVVPPGTYKLNAYGSDLRGHDVTITVPAGKTELTVEPISLKASAFVLMQGRPAPELIGVLGWKGKPAKLADLKGKLVLLEFTGYWCGPCMGSMPVLIELHEKYAGRGLAIVGVHVDTDGEVATAEQLDEKFAEIRKSLWKGKDVPFPVALTSGKQVGDGDDRSRGQAAAQYGVTKYPTAILIDRDGKVVREFHARDVKIASEEIEKLLNEKK